jgi:GNAT superfamily N-acetyltransferase
VRSPHDEALHDEALHEVGAYPGRGPWDLDRIEAEYPRAGRGFPVGELKRLSDERAKLMRMRAETSLQSRGLGRKMLEESENRASGLGYSTLYLDTTAWQSGARRLYTSSGYRRTGLASTRPFDCVYHERDLLRHD